MSEKPIKTVTHIVPNLRFRMWIQDWKKKDDIEGSKMKTGKFQPVT